MRRILISLFILFLLLSVLGIILLHHVDSYRSQIYRLDSTYNKRHGKVIRNAVRSSLTEFYRNKSRSKLHDFILENMSSRTLLTYSLIVILSGEKPGSMNALPLIASFLTPENEVAEEVLESNFLYLATFSEVQNITEASLVYFEKLPAELTLQQSIRLSSLLFQEGESHFSRETEFIRKCNTILQKLYEDGIISKEDFELTVESFSVSF